MLTSLFLLAVVIYIFKFKVTYMGSRYKVQCQGHRNRLANISRIIVQFVIPTHPLVRCKYTSVESIIKHIGGEGLCVGGQVIISSCGKHHWNGHIDVLRTTKKTKTKLVVSQKMSSFFLKIWQVVKKEKLATCGYHLKSNIAQRRKSPSIDYQYQKCLLSPVNLVYFLLVCWTCWYDKVTKIRHVGFFFAYYRQGQEWPRSWK